MFKKILYFELFHSIYLIGVIVLFPILILIAIVNKIINVLRNILDPQNTISGQVAVITGSGRGLGREIAKELAARGCHIAVVDIQEQLALETAKYLNDTYKVKANAYQTDIRDYEQLQLLRYSITEDLGIPTILINNAAVIVSSSLKNPPPQEVKQMIDVNFTSLCYILQIFLPKMKELNQGHIVNICSASALFTLPIIDVYAATKAAIRSLTSALRIECILERKNIKVTTVMPTFLTTNKRIEKATKLVGMQDIFPLMDGEIVAKYVIDGMLSGSREITVPCVLLCVYKIFEILPIFIKELVTAGFLYRKYKTIVNSSELSEVLKKNDFNDHLL